MSDIPNLRTVVANVSDFVSVEVRLFFFSISRGVVDELTEVARIAYAVEV